MLRSEVSTVEHLKYLAWMNYAFAALFAISLLFTGLGGLAVVGLGLSSGGDMGSVMVSVITFGILAVVLGVFMLVYVMAGRQVSRGRGRILQSILSVLSLGSVPIGTIYGGYGLWVCWMNEDTKKVFDEPYGLVP
jgi:hypothetical protein